MKTKPHFIILFLVANIFFTSYRASSQSNRIEFERISIDQGLSQSTIYCMLQDYLGYMWFGTEDGLNQYDGFNFKVYLNNQRIEGTISNNRIMALMEDSNNNLWVGTLGGGLNRFNRDDDTFIAYHHNPQDSKSISSNIVMSLFEGTDGKILTGTAGGGLNIFNPITEDFKSYISIPDDPSSLLGNLVRSILITSDTTILIGTDKGLCFFDQENEKFTHISDVVNQTDEILYRTIISITEDSRGDIWLSVDDGGVICYSPVTQTYQTFSRSSSSDIKLANNSVLSVYEDDNQNLWFATYGGLQLYDRASKKATTYTSSLNDPSSLSSKIIRCIYEDKSGVMWIGTYRDGINKFNRKYKKFTTYRNDINVLEHLPHSSVRSILEVEPEKILFGTYGNGIFKLNLINDSITLNPYNIIRTSEPSERYVTSMVTDLSGNIWIAYDALGLKMLDINKKKVKSFVNNENQNGYLPTNRIRCLYVDKKGILWIGSTGEGLIKYNEKSDSFTTYKPNYNEPESSLSQDRILCTFEDDRNNFWVGTSNEGLNLFNRETGKSTHFKHSTNDTLSISSNRIISLHQDPEGRLWVGTGGGGLNLFDYETKTFRSFTKADGLPNDVIYGMLDDEDGNLWLSTNYGICKFTYQTEGFPIIKNYTKSDGLQCNEFTEGAYLKLTSGSLVFGGIEGISIFDPKTIIDNPVEPNVIIEKIDISKNVRETGERFTQTVKTFKNKILELPFNQNNITFHFIALHFQNSQGNEYLFKLEGFDNEWISPASGQRFVTYTNLQPGSYNFKVIAANSDGVWNKEGDTISITILPPFWGTWWFIFMTILFAFGTFALIIRLREANLIRMKRSLEEKVKKRTEEILKQKEEFERQRNNLARLNEELHSKNEEITTQHNELERTQKQLIQSEKMASIGLLAAGIAHELNNPINFVYGGVNSITRDLMDIDPILRVIKEIEDMPNNPSKVVKKIITLKKEYEFFEAYNAIIQTINDIKLGAERTAEIVEGLRNFSRTESEEWNDSNLHKMLDGTLILLKNKYKNHVEIVKNYDVNLPLIECKTGKINQVIMNILVNAIDAIEKKGKIYITTCKKENNCIFTIKDTGKGMEENTLSHIFDPFYTTKKIGKGVGLGLSITYGIIEEHGGTIEVNSKMGIGTEFVITIPIKQSFLK